MEVVVLFFLFCLHSYFKLVADKTLGFTRISLTAIIFFMTADKETYQTFYYHNIAFPSHLLSIYAPVYTCINVFIGEKKKVKRDASSFLSFGIVLVPTVI